MATRKVVSREDMSRVIKGMEKVRDGVELLRIAYEEMPNLVTEQPPSTERIFRMDFDEMYWEVVNLINLWKAKKKKLKDVD